MRIALLSQKPQRRGAELFSRELAGELRLRGHEVLELYLYPAPADERLTEAEAGAYLDGDESHWLERLTGWHPSLAQRLRQRLQEFAPDVVQANGGRTVKYAARVVGRLPGGPLLVYRNIGEPAVWIRGWRRRWLYSTRVFPKVGAVVTIGRRFVPALRAACQNAVEVRWIPRGVDRRALAPARGRSAVRASLGTLEDVPVVLYLGRLSREKRPDRLLRVFASASDEIETSVLWMAGGGALEPEARQLAERLGCAARCRFLGVRDDVGDLIAAADVVVLTSDTEGSPGALREAAALGRPVVATRVGASAEIVVDGETGRLFEREDEQGFAEALREMLVDPEARARMGAAALRASRDHSPATDEVAARYEQLYRDALAAGGRNAGRPR